MGPLVLKPIYKPVAALIGLASWVATGFAASRCIDISGGNVIQAFLLFFEYLTHWTVIMTAFTFSFIAVGFLRARHWWWVGQCVIMNVAMAIGYWSGASWLQFTIQPMYLRFLHAPLPLISLIYWICFIDHRRVRLNDSAIWLVCPLVYTGWMEAYGFFSGNYPYQPLDPFHEGRIKTFVSIAEIFLLSSVSSYCLYIIDWFIPPFYSFRRE